ncbi:septation protein A [Thiofilum flexile]|uniref:septation protein A n=1 Tax=Thiofilum flexile TaxID=125627 RepID=UPI00035DDD94|nr:septation protein A [Thiofilum flexile]
MKQLFDFLPVVIFFLIYKFYGDIPPQWIELANRLPLVELTPGEPKHAILLATLGIIIATLIQNIVHFVIYRKLERMHVISLAILIAFGSLTLAFRDGNFIIWKVTVINWLFAAVFLGSEWVGERKPLVERMMGKALQVPRPIWLKANRLWVGFFLVLGILNLIVAYNFSETAWVNFKLFGVLGLTLVFVIAQAFYLQRHALNIAEDK